MKNFLSTKSTQIALCLVISTATAIAQNVVPIINDSTEARYRHEVVETTYSQIPPGMSIQDVDIAERDLLKSRTNRYVFIEGVSSQDETFYEILSIEAEFLEDWLRMPMYRVHTPKASMGFNDSRELEYKFLHSDSELESVDKQRDLISDYGFQPVMMFFPSKLDPFVELAQQDGAVLTELPDDGFKLTWTDTELVVEPQELRITEFIETPEEEIKTITEYELYAPYGYVESYSREESQQLEFDHPVTHIVESRFSNHLIEDPTGRIEKYTDHVYLEIQPVPVASEYSVQMRGLPDATVSQVVVYDQMGITVATHANPPVSSGLIELNGSSYPSGILILQVFTDQGIYAETITK